MAFDLSQIAQLMKLVQDVDLDRIISLAEKIDVNRLMQAISEMEESDLIRLADTLQSKKVEVDKRATTGGNDIWHPSTGNQREFPIHTPFRSVVIISNSIESIHIAIHLANAGFNVHFLQYPLTKGADPDENIEKILYKYAKAQPGLFYSEESFHLIHVGSFDAGAELLQQADWIIEDVNEDLEVNRTVIKHLSVSTANNAAVSTTNIIADLETFIENTPETFRKRFFGIRFTDPTRLGKSLEIYPSQHTDREIIKRVSWFSYVHLGKNVNIINTVSTAGDGKAVSDGVLEDHTDQTIGRQEYRSGEVITLSKIREDTTNILWENKSAALLDIGDDVVLFEFKSRANTLGTHVLTGMLEVFDRVDDDPNIRGMVIGNDGPDFSMGANLAELAIALRREQYDLIEQTISNFQKITQRIRYAGKPIVVAVHHRALGGGCELALACPFPVALAESYLGLVEQSVGLLPAGSGCMYVAAMASERTPHRHPIEIQGWLEKLFLNVVSAKVSTSTRQAQAMLYLPAHAREVMHPDRLLYVAKEEVVHLSRLGYVPPTVRDKIVVLGRSGRARLDNMLQQQLEGQYISEYDRYLGSQVAYVITGGDLSSSQEVHEEYILELEREAFMGLLGQQKTQDRLLHVLRHNERLCN